MLTTSSSRQTKSLSSVLLSPSAGNQFKPQEGAPTPQVSTANAAQSAAEANYRYRQSSTSVSDAERKIVQDAGKTAVDTLKAAAANPAKRSLLAAAIAGKNADPEKIAKLVKLLADFADGRIPAPKFIAAQTTSDATVFKGAKVDQWIGKDVIPSAVEAAYAAGPQGGRVLVNPGLSEDTLKKVLLHEVGHMLEAAAKARGVAPGIGEVGARIELAMEGKDPNSIAENNEASGNNVIMVRVDGKLVKAKPAVDRDVQNYKLFYPTFKAIADNAQSDIIVDYVLQNGLAAPGTSRTVILTDKVLVDRAKQAMSKTYSSAVKANLLRENVIRIAKSNPTWHQQLLLLNQAAVNIAQNSTPAEAAAFNITRPSFSTELQAICHLIGNAGLDDAYVSAYTYKVNQGNALSGLGNAANEITKEVQGRGNGGSDMLAKAIDVLRNAKVPHDPADPFDNQLVRIRAIFAAGALRGSVAWVRVATEYSKIKASIALGKGADTLTAARFEAALNAVATEARFAAAIRRVGVSAGAFTNVLKLIICPMVVVGMGLDIASGSYKTAPGPFALRFSGNLSYLLGLPALWKNGWEGLRTTYRSYPLIINGLRPAEIEMRASASATATRMTSSGAAATLFNSAEHVASGRPPMTMAAHEALASHEVATGGSSSRPEVQINAEIETVSNSGGSAVAATTAGEDAATAAEAATMSARVASLGGRLTSPVLMKATFGIGDILIGAATIWQGANDLQAHRKTRGGLEISSGVFNTVAGVAMLAALAVPVAAPVLAPIAAICTVVGAALSIASFFW